MSTKTERKQVKHVFTREEKEALSHDLVNELARSQSIELELTQVKSNYKAKIDESAAKIGTLTQHLQSGFEFRTEELEVQYFPKQKLKRYYRPDCSEFVIEEEMSPADFQMELKESTRGGAK